MASSSHPTKEQLREALERASARIEELERLEVKRRLAEEALRQSEEIHRITLASISDAVFITRHDGRFTYICPNADNIFGFTPDEIQQFGHISNLLGDSIFNQNDLDTLGEIPNIERSIRDKFHRQHTLLINVKRVSIDGGTTLYTCRDITERKYIEEERDRLVTAIEQAAEMVIVTDTSGTVQYVNPAFERTTGYTREDILGRNMNLLKSGKHDRAFYDTLWKTILKGEVWTGRFINRRKDGTLWEEDATISPIKDKTGKPVNFVAVKRDVTQEVALQAQLRQSQKLEAVGQLAGGVAHDFNNILQTILGAAQLARLGTQVPEKTQEDLNDIIKAAKRGAALTRQLLTFSRRQIVKPIDLDINQLIAHLLKMLRRLIGEQIEFVFQPTLGIRTIHADPGMLEQVVMNLCVNARDAMPHGGKLTIRTENVDRHYFPSEPTLKDIPKPCVRLTVSDTGTGISPKVLERIFEPFYTTKEFGRGSGLGLATVHGIVQQHHGSIHVESQPGIGTTFTIELPAVDRAPASIEPVPVESSSGGNETILLAEDDKAVQAIIARALREKGYTVITAGRGSEAVQLFERYEGTIDLVMLDAIMPEESGRSACDRIRTLDPQVRILFSSGYRSDSQEWAEIYQQGMELIQKPYEIDELLQKVREILDR